MRVGAIYAEAKSPDVFAKATTLFDCANPMKEMTFCRRSDQKRVYHEKDGFFGPVVDGRTLLLLPEGLFKGKKGTRFRAIIDMNTRQAEEGSLWSLCFQAPDAPVVASTSVPTPGGDSGEERYVLDLKKSNANVSDTYHIYFRWGDDGRVKLNRVRIERLDS